MSGPRILIVDDHPVLCQGITVLLERAGLTVAGAATSLDEARRLLPVASPDVVLVDLNLGGDADGITFLEELAQAGAPARRLVYSIREDAESIRRSLEAKALGYVTKAEVWDMLVTAILAVAAGQRFLSPRARRALDEPSSTIPVDPLATVSKRERAVFRLLGEGFQVAEIAARLGVSPRTVETFCGRLIVKLELAGMRELRRAAIAARR
jgi:DNA-binding NarL/FixJ family response regulator